MHTAALLPLEDWSQMQSHAALTRRTLLKAKTRQRRLCMRCKYDVQGKLSHEHFPST